MMRVSWLGGRPRPWVLFAMSRLIDPLDLLSGFNLALFSGQVYYASIYLAYVVWLDLCVFQIDGCCVLACPDVDYM